MKNNILIVAAHPDDEVLGAGGTILKHTEYGETVHILFLGDGEASRDIGADIKKRQNAALATGKALGAAEVFFESFPDNQFDSVSLLHIIKKIEAYIARLQPTIIYTHHRGDVNVDHQRAFQAVLTACRPQPGFCVKKILSFETLSSTEWQAKKADQIFCPNEYTDITKYIEKKAEILGFYQDEMRPYPHPRSKEGVRALARYRGMESGYAYAEAFEIIRMLVD